VKLEQFCRKLEGQLAHAKCCQEKVQTVERLLCELSRSPFSCRNQWQCDNNRYARHLVYHGETSGCCIVAMSWAPGQGTPVHDHDGTWCVECCLEGQLEVIQYELETTREKEGEKLFVFQPREKQSVGRGAVGCLIPPYEHHIIRNPFPDRAVTLHVYGKELKKSSCFYPVQEDLYRREEKALSYTN